MNFINDKLRIFNSFCTLDECKVLKAFILNNEERIKELGPDLYRGTEDDSLTGRYHYHNFLNELEVKEILEPKLKTLFEKMDIKLPVSVQCWANTFRKDEGIILHSHSTYDEFLCMNLFISGPTLPGTTYLLEDKYVNFENKIGDLCLFKSDLYHGVSPNKKDEIRISMAFDIISGIEEDRNRYYLFS